MAQARLNVGALFDALDRQRWERGMSWREVARELGVSSSLFTRMSHGLRPDVDTFCLLLTWLDIDAPFASFDGGC